MPSDLSDFIISNEGFIYSIINKYQKYFDINDLYQAAVMGIVKASKKFNENYNTKFLSFAYKYVLGEVISFVNANRPIKVSKDYLTIYKKILEAKTILTQKLMKEPSNFEIAVFLEMDETLIDDIILSTMESDSLDRTIIADGKELTLLDKVDSQSGRINTDYIMLNSEIEALPEPEKTIIKLNYFQDKTQEEIAEIIGMYQVQVSRKRQNGLKILRKSLNKAA